MAKIGFSGGEDDKKPGTGTGTGGNSGGSTGGNSGAGTGTGTGTNSGGGKGDSSSGIRDILTGNYISGDRDGSGIVSGRYPFGNQNTDTTSNEEKAETSLAELRNEYSKILQDKYNYSAQKLKEERDAALRENWILGQQAQAALPEQMAAAGLNGGATETSLANLRAQFQGNHNDIQSDYQNNLGELGQQHLSEQAQGTQSYNEKWLEYLLDIARAEATAKYNR